MTTITIRQAAPPDLARVVDHYGSGDTPWDPFGDVENLQRIPLEGLLVAEVDGQYAGFLYWFTGENPWFDPSIRRFAYITEVQVLEKYQGQGVGKRLLTSALQQLKECTVYISTTEENAAARHLYEDAGFQPFSRTIHYRLVAGDRRT